jgi:hypothetical protein
MAWKVWANPILTADLAAGVSQKVRFNSNVVLRACRIWLIFYNNPALTDLTMKIYSNDGGVPRKLLHSSTTTLTKSQIITLENGVKEVYFDFNYPSFDGDDFYHFVLTGSGYTGTASSHIAWRVGWPDPVYLTNFTPNLANCGTAPLAIYFIGSSLT